MLTVTEPAGAHFAKLLADSDAAGDDDAVIRMVYTPQGFGLELSQPGTDDVKFDHDGVGVLVIEQELATKLGDATIDLEETPEGHQLTLKK